MRRLPADSRVVAALIDSARSLHMIARLIAAWPLERYQLWLAYSDGAEGAVDLEDRLQEWSLDSLHDVRLFRQMALDRGLNRLVWPDGTELETTVLHREICRRQRRSTRRNWRRH